jgi:hypothetical protein
MLNTANDLVPPDPNRALIDAARDAACPKSVTHRNADAQRIMVFFNARVDGTSPAHYFAVTRSERVDWPAVR